MDQITSSSYEQHPQNTMKSSISSYHNSLHSVRKPLSVGKPTTKHFIAPLPPTPLKIYNVEASKFKEVVRVLTSTPEFQYPSPRRLKDKAPPPLNLSSSQPKPESLFPKSTRPLEGGGMMSPLSTFLMSPDLSSLFNETMQASRFGSSIPGMDYFEELNQVGLDVWKPAAHDGALMSPRGFTLSPTSLSWCSSVLFSPGTSLSATNQSPLL